MAKLTGQVCPNMSSPEWALLVEQEGSEVGAMKVWKNKDALTEKKEFQYPFDILLDADLMKEDSGMDPVKLNEKISWSEDQRATRVQVKPDARLMRMDEEIEKAKVIIAKKITKFKARPSKTKTDKKTIADFETLLDNLTNLEAAAAIAEFVQAAGNMARKAQIYLNKVESGEKDPSLKQFLRIKEFESSFELLETLLPELENDPEFAEDAARAKEIIASINIIKQQRLAQQRELQTQEWAPRIGVINARYEREAEMDFNLNEKHKHTKGKERDEALEKHIYEYMLKTSADRKVETEDYTKNLLSKIDDIGGLSAYVMNPKDLHNEIIDYATYILDRADFGVRQEIIREAKAIQALHRKIREENPGVHNMQKLYDPLLEKDEDGKPNGRYINPVTSKKELIQFRKDYAGTALLEFYNDLIKKQKARDRMIPKYARLGYNIARMNRNNIERLQSQGIFTATGNMVTDIFKIKDSDMFGEIKDEDAEVGEDSKGTNKTEGTQKVTLNEANEEVKFVPIHYRSKKRVTNEDMSYDLATIAVIETNNVLNYVAKTDVAVKLNLIMDSVYNGGVRQRTGLRKLLKVDSKNGREALVEGFKSQVYKVLNGLVDSRVYGIKIGGDKKTAHIANQVKSIVSTVNMGFNKASGVTNFLQGSMATWIDASGSKNALYSRKNRLNGSKKYNKDVFNGSMIADLGRNIPESKTNLLLQMLDQSDDFHALDKAFVLDNLAKMQADKGLLFSYQSMTEQAIHAVLMYAVFDNVKMKNADGKYINKEGEVVETREEAMTYDEAFTVVNGSLVKNEHAAASEVADKFDEEGDFVASNLFSRASRDLFGNYNSQNRSLFQMTVIGNMVEHMRGWFFTGVAKRWKGIETAGMESKDMRPEHLKYNRETKRLEEGTYVSVIRFFYVTAKQLKASKLKTRPEVWKTLTTAEKANIMKAAREAALIIVLLLAAGALDDDDDNIVYAYYSMRVANEFLTFSDPGEFLRTAKSPMIAFDYLSKVYEFAGQSFSPTERYVSGRRAGQLKITKKFGDIMPVLKQRQKSYKEQYTWLSR